ncbi:MAG: preprotein translocase subunit SecE [Actinobacteria bacterium]|nr:preprotein translocase subunit SecE [Actinomycetota bacterium]
MSKISTSKKKSNTVNQMKRRAYTQKGQSKTGFIDGTKSEISRIEWPSKDVVMRAFILILVILFLSVLFIAGLDAIFTKLFFNLKQTLGQ